VIFDEQNTCMLILSGENSTNFRPSV